MDAPHAHSVPRIPALDRAPLWLRLTLTVVATGLAIVLITRPLTAVLVLVFGTAALVFIRGVRDLRRRRIGMGAAWVILGVLMTIGWAHLARALPLVAPVALDIGGILVFIRALRGPERSRAVRSALCALTGIGLLGVALSWADVVVLLFAWAVPVTLVVIVLRTWIRAPRLRGVGRWVAVTGGALVTVAALVGAGVTGADVVRPSPFYAWTDDVPNEPGVLLRVEPYEGHAPAGSTASRILYTTTDVRDRIVVASAVVAVPTAAAPAEGRVVLAWQHGTTGVSVPCAPSLTDAALTDEAIVGATDAIARGWVVVATDYPGQGTTGDYPYLVGVGEGRASLDAVRALEGVDGANPSDRTMLWGHSQGGHATLWAAEIAPEYAPELDVIGVAALSAATDPLALARGLTAKDSPLGDVITSFVLVPYDLAYDDVVLDDVVHPAGEPIARAAATRCLLSGGTAVSLLAAVAISRDTSLYRLDIDAGPEHDRLAENVAPAAFTAPLFLGQGVADEVVPISIQRTLAARLCEAPGAVAVHEYADQTHMGVIAPGGQLTADLWAWTDRILAGEQPRDCG